MHGIPLERSIAVDEMCRANGVKFIRGEVRGVFGSLFCDFGPAFDVHDVDGEEPLTCIVASISNDATPLVTCVDDERVELQDGQRVTFAEVRGMTELNDGKPRTVKNVKAHSFELADCDATDFGAYVGGIVTQVKEQALGVQAAEGGDGRARGVPAQRLRQVRPLADPARRLPPRSKRSWREPDGGASQARPTLTPRRWSRSRSAQRGRGGGGQGGRRGRERRR